jgi:hypothetical protein
LADQEENESGVVLAIIEQFAMARNQLKEHSEIRTNAEHL